MLEVLGGRKETVVKRAMEYVHERYAEPLRRAEIAGYVGVGERQIDRYFRRVIGVPPMQYLAKHRVRQAIRLLTETDKSITTIGFETGFSAPAYFAKVFRRQVGLSPREYRTLVSSKSPNEVGA